MSSHYNTAGHYSQSYTQQKKLEAAGYQEKAVAKGSYGVGVAGWKRGIIILPGKGFKPVYALGKEQSGPASANQRLYQVVRQSREDHGREQESGRICRGFFF